MSSVFDVLSWSQFDDIYLATSVGQISRRRQRNCRSDGSHEPTIGCVVSVEVRPKTVLLDHRYEVSRVQYKQNRPEDRPLQHTLLDRRLIRAAAGIPDVLFAPADRK